MREERRRKTGIRVMMVRVNIGCRGMMKEELALPRKVKADVKKRAKKYDRRI